MKLSVGQNVSLRVYPEIPGGRAAGFGERYVDYNQLLGILELQLGIVHVAIPYAERVIAYREKLAAADTKARFYHASFAIDPLGVAKTLLSWRDDLAIYAGGSIAFLEHAKSARFKDLAAVEAAGQSLPPGEAERVSAIISGLVPSKPDISNLNLLEPLEIIPAVYRRLFTALQSAGVTVEEVHWTEDASSSGNLAIFQKSLRSEKPAQLGPRDETLCVIETQSDAIAAELLSRYLQENKAEGRLILDEHQSSIIDLIATANGVPCQGYSEVSNFRPILQTLPIYLNLFWKPLEVYSLLDFLLLPVSPIPGKIRHKLADAVASQPGIGGREWLAVLAEADAEDQQKVRDLLEFERCDAETGAPVKLIIDQCVLLAKWARGLGQVHKDETAQSQLIVLASQISELVQLLKQRTGKVTRIELSQLAELVTTTGLDASDRQAEAGKARLINNPECLLGPVDELVWFDFTGEDLWTLPQSHWLAAELAELKALGVALPDNDAIARHRAAAAIRAVCQVQKRLILVCPKHKAGQETTFHPLHELAKGRLTNWESIFINEGELFAHKELPLAPLEIRQQTIRQLPEPQRYWQIDRKIEISNARTESYSSLSNLFYYPYIYLLQYSADLKAASVSTVAGDAMLLGTIAHEVIQSFLTGKLKANVKDYDELRAKVETVLRPQLEKEAATFLLPGKGAPLESLLHSITRSIQELGGLLHANGFNKFEVEKQLEKEFQGGKLTGYVDLIAEGKGREPVIIDLKWGGYTKRRDELQMNNALQLLIYAYLLRDKAWPDYAYFIISRAALLPATDTFAGISGLTPAGSDSAAALWKKLEATFAYRAAQFKKGLIEVPLGALNEDLAEELPNGLLPMPGETASYNDFTVLTGEGVR